MKSRKRNPRTWRMEHLEDRRLMAVDVQVLNGDLVVSGTAAAAVEVVAQSDGSYVVNEGGTAVGTYTGVNDDIIIKLDADKAEANDSVTIDLGGKTVDSVSVSLGNGNNSLTVKNGTVNSGLTYRTAEGDDSLTIAADATIAKDVDAIMGSGDNMLSLLGKVQRGLRVRTGSGDDSITLGTGSSVARDVSLNLGNGDNSVSISGSIGRSLDVTAGVGDDLVDLLAGATVGAGSTLISVTATTHSTHQPLLRVR